MVTTTLLTTAALALHDAGCSVVPVRADGTKAPAAFWKNYQTTRPDRDEVSAWTDGGQYEGIGVVCGAVSGQLELLELEGRAVNEGVLTELAHLLTDNGFGDLWQRLNRGYLEQTPSGGLHWLYRVDGEARRNTKLARRPATADELVTDPQNKIQVLIETRGEGGFVVTAPSNGRSHSTGRAWTLLAGGPDSIPLVTVEERDALYAVASLLDRMPADDPPQPRNPSVGSRPDGDLRRPGDDYNIRATWAEILEPHGWTPARRFGNATGWRRPGKPGPGISATTGRNDADNLYVFSTSTEFEPEKPYSKFAAYTLLEHGGDYSAAAKALRAAGYGTAEPTRATDTAYQFSAAPTVDGNLATVTDMPAEPPRLAVVNERTYERSDDGNALALIERFGDRIRFCPERGRWLAWDGCRWHWCAPGGGIVREYAKRIARALPDTDQAAVTHKKKSLGAAGTSNMLQQAETDNRISVPIDDLDAHPWELNTPAGIIDLRTGHIGPCDPARLHTRVTACAPDFDADNTTWHQFLTDTFGEVVLTGYLQRLVGYSAVGIVGPHVLPFCYGSGGNGKGVFLESVTQVLGDYATTAPSRFLMAQTYAGHETEIARLAGARMVLCSEVNEDDRFDEAKVKQLTGGDTLTARFMRQDHFTFQATHQLWLMGNSQPAVKSGGRSFWRRVRLIPFLNEVPEEKQIDDLQGILVKEHGPAILAWIARGASEYHSGGLREPDTVKAATAEYAHEQDTVGRFVEEMCHLGGGPAVKIKMSIVRSAYERWCATGGDVPVSTKRLGTELRNRFGIEADRTSKDKFYVGITVLEDDDRSSDRSSDRSLSSSDRSPETDDRSPETLGGWR